MKFRLVLLVIIVGVITFFPLTHTNAYTETSSGLPLFIKLSPENPGPNQTTNISLNGYGFDLNTAAIDWQVNGKKLTPDQHTSNIQVTTGPVGSATIITVTATAGQQTGQKTIIIRPAVVNLLWQTNSSVPKNYLGKPLAPRDSIVTIVAIPNFTNPDGTQIRAEDLVYDWEKDYQKIGSLSGLGKNTFNIINRPGANRVAVTVSSLNKQQTAVGSIIITPAEPKVVFYENQPLTGTLLNKAITNLENLTKSEIGLAAETYYFSKNANLQYNWLMNGKPFTTTASQNNQAILRQPEKTTGQSDIKVEVTNPENTIENASAGLNILFGNSNSLF